MADRRLTRPVHRRMIAGVCTGLADYLQIDPTIVRVIFVVAFFAGLSASFWIYLVLWLVMPQESIGRGP